MSADAAGLDPYRSPSLPEGPQFSGGPARKPGWLTALCVMCIVLGALGLINACFGTVLAVAGPQIQSLFQPKATPGMPPEMQQAQDELNADLQAIVKKHYVLIVAFLAFRFVVTLGLLIGGLRCLGLHESGRKLLLAACALALIFELSSAIQVSIVNMDNMTAVNSFVEKLQSSMPQNNAGPGLANFMKWWMRVMFIVQIVLIYGWSLLKAALFLFGLVYLQKPHIKRLFQPTAPNAPSLTP